MTGGLIKSMLDFFGVTKFFLAHYELMSESASFFCSFWLAVMCVYSALFMRFAWMVQPRNYHLLVCHASNETVQLYQLSRWVKAQG